MRPTIPTFPDERSGPSDPGLVWHWYDVICPFCYVGQDRSALLERHGLQLAELGFEIHPETPASGRFVGARHGLVYENLEREARLAGLPLRWPDRIAYQGPRTRRGASGTGPTARASKPFVAGAPSTACKSGPGEFAPVVDRSKCEGKAKCVEVCPYHVFEVGRIEDADFAKLGTFARFKSIVHRRQTAYTPKASACEACGKCVEACPEKAIKLARVST
jgi:NAD-dependent dihydropyrimidine dehydrogenase PreA subunit